MALKRPYIRLRGQCRRNAVRMSEQAIGTTPERMSYTVRRTRKCFDMETLTGQYTVVKKIKMMPFIN